MDFTTDIARYLGYVGSIVVVVKLLTASLARRVAAIEKEAESHPKRTEISCEQMMTKCPAQVRICGFERILSEIKTDIKDVQSDIKDHIKFHLKE